VYIEQCHARIAEQEKHITEQDKGLDENRVYIEQCHARIAEQDGIILVDQQKNAFLESTISQLDTDIQRIKNIDILNRKRIALQKVQLEKAGAHGAALESELIALRAEHAEQSLSLERYRSYRVVKILDKFFPENR